MQLSAVLKVKNNDCHFNVIDVLLNYREKTYKGVL